MESDTHGANAKVALYECMWEDVGILRTADGLQRGIHKLAELNAQLSLIGVAGNEPAFSMARHDWLNLKSLIAVGRVIATAALASEDSRGAHYREDFPDTGDLPGSTYAVVHQTGGARTFTPSGAFQACAAWRDDFIDPKSIRKFPSESLRSPIKQ